MKAKRTTTFSSSCGACIKLVAGEDICPRTPLYAVERMIELGLIDAPVKELVPVTLWKDLR